MYNDGLHDINHHIVHDESKILSVVKILYDVWRINIEILSFFDFWEVFYLHLQ